MGSFTPFDYLGMAVNIAFLIGYFGFHLHYRPVKAHLNEWMVLIFYGFSTINIYYILYIMRQNEEPIGNILGPLAYGVIIGMFALIFLMTGFCRLFKKLTILNERRTVAMQKFCTKQDKRRPVVKDFWRKFFHMCYFGVIVGVYGLANYISGRTIPHDGYYLYMFWCIQPVGRVFYFELVRNPAIYTDIGVLRSYLFFIFHLGCTIAIFLDWVRLSDKCWTLGRNLLLYFARPEEVEGIPSFIPIFAGILPLVFLIDPIPILAIMVTVIFADTAASQIGIRYGKHKIPWNQKKSWEGLIAGSITAMLTWILVGPIYAVFAMIGYIIGDGLTEKPLPISDNLFTPLITGILFTLLTISGIPYIAPAWMLG